MVNAQIRIQRSDILCWMFKLLCSSINYFLTTVPNSTQCLIEFINWRAIRWKKNRNSWKYSKQTLKKMKKTIRIRNHIENCYNNKTIKIGVNHIIVRIVFCQKNLKNETRHVKSELVIFNKSSRQFLQCNHAMNWNNLKNFNKIVLTERCD